jgi:hypothetical protein
MLRHVSGQRSSQDAIDKTPLTMYTFKRVNVFNRSNGLERKLLGLLKHNRVASRRRAIALKFDIHIRNSMFCARCAVRIDTDAGKELFNCCRAPEGLRGFRPSHLWGKLQTVGCMFEQRCGIGEAGSIDVLRIAHQKRINGTPILEHGETVSPAQTRRKGNGQHKRLVEPLRLPCVRRRNVVAGSSLASLCSEGASAADRILAAFSDMGPSSGVLRGGSGASLYEVRPAAYRSRKSSIAAGLKCTWVHWIFQRPSSLA